MTGAVDSLRREAEELRALAQEHTEPETLERRIYDAAELAVLKLADGLERAFEEAA